MTVAQRKGGWVRYGDAGEDSPQPILEDFLAPVREAGQGVHLKNLYNDYVYFWRWALWKVLDSTEDPGIVTFITASSYLRGPGFSGMRRKMREVFDELWIIDLEGGSLGARKTKKLSQNLNHKCIDRFPGRFVWFLQKHREGPHGETRDAAVWEVPGELWERSLLSSWRKTPPRRSGAARR